MKYNIYLAGGMTDFINTPDEMINWRLDVKDKLEHYKCDYKVKCFNPVEYYSLEEATSDIEVEAMKFDLHKLINSQLVIINFNAPTSLGSMAELAIAYDRDIPVIGLNESEQQLHPWQYSMTSKIFNNMEDMLKYIYKYYLN